MIQLKNFFFTELISVLKAYVCNSDTSGSKIVPIAVGAALAFLIIVVLIAFVVGRIINRQKNTYEPLN